MLVVVINKSDESVSSSWGSDHIFVPAKSAVALEEEIAKTLVQHEDYQHLEWTDDFGGESQESYAKMITADLQGRGAKVENVKPMNKPAPVRQTASVEPDPDWDPTDCAYEEVDAYIEKNGLTIDPDANEETVRQIVLEHVMG